ncbi:MAG: PAC2 family protein [Bifidobacterium psychraerophilum]|uniref:PAC2 family protein n=1 Tax=Bifidobacterium psychraerophilum TaxID=218140 RepID=UPI0039E7C751
MSEEALQSQNVLIAAFEGWNDACQAATNVLRHLIDVYDSHEVARINCDGFYDYQISRPMMCHVQGQRRIVWPETVFYEIRIDPDHIVYAQMAPEPNYRWKEYCRESMHIAEQCDVDAIVTLGSMYADCPHTRPLPVESFNDDCGCATEDEHCGPIGVPTVLDTMAEERGFTADPIWVSVPQYLGSDECAQGTLQLLRTLSELLGVHLDEGDLQERADRWKAQAEVLVRCNDDLADYVHRLEREYDFEQKARKQAEMSTLNIGDIVAEAESYLRGPGSGPSSELGAERQ